MSKSCFEGIIWYIKMAARANTQSEKTCEFCSEIADNYAQDGTVFRKIDIQNTAFACILRNLIYERWWLNGYSNRGCFDYRKSLRYDGTINQNALKEVVVWCLVYGTTRLWSYCWRLMNRTHLQESNFIFYPPSAAHYIEYPPSECIFKWIHQWSGIAKN